MRRFSAPIGMALGLGVLSACGVVDSDSAVSAIPPLSSAIAMPAGISPFVQAGRDARPPSGYVAFCQREPDACVAHPGQDDKIKLTDEIWARLEKVNHLVNAAIRPEEDLDHYGVADYWTVPVDGAGDCEDYVLAKRKMLVLLGLPEPALRITVVLDHGTIRHAVLTVATDRGDFVLDSLKDEILATGQADYVWVERQDRASRTGWIALR
jgi:predicted transglutaminase-like cysteine proteinase